MDIKKIWSFCAEHLPEEVEKYLEDKGYYTHGEHSLVSVHDDGNVLAEWLLEQGGDFDGKSWMWVAMFAT